MSTLVLRPKTGVWMPLGCGEVDNDASLIAWMVGY
jgi:hypothetical protein